MKSLKYTLVISLLAALCPAPKALACWGPFFSPKGYYMFRVTDVMEEQGTAVSPSNPNGVNNCLEWQRYASPDISLGDIYEVVYKMPLVDFEKFHEDSRGYKGKNAFLEWLCRNKEASDFLLFAKITEDVRGRENSRWYYPSMKTGARMPLEEIADKALGYQGPLRDRYLLQGIRALFSLRRYEECITLWDNEISRLPKESVIRRMILPYIAGAEYWMRNYDKAVAYCYEAGDYIAMLAYSGDRRRKSTAESIERIYNYEPNFHSFPKMLKEFIRNAESTSECPWLGDSVVTAEHRQLARLAIRIAEEGKTNNPAMWYYTAAFIEDLDGHAARASQILSKAEQVHGTDYIKESVKVMRIYLDAKLMAYNQSYENRLFDQLQWLDRKIVGNITPEVRERTSRTNYLFYNISYYYWNDMMRRILLGEVCPRMISAGKTVRALQLANMADNRLLGLVDCLMVCKEKDVKGQIQWIEENISMHEYRWDKDIYGPDYSNSFFEMIDSIGLSHAIKYRHRVIYPLNSFDRFLNERGYVDMNYINDIVGTQCLRSMRYSDAVRYLGQVSRSFDGHLNTEIQYDPFAYERHSIDNTSDFKYSFAREMQSLEYGMAAVTDPNRKAELMIRYAVGIQNSFGRCWPLTQYYYGTTFYGKDHDMRDWTNDPEVTMAIARSTKLLQQANSLFVDKEVAAKALYKLKRFRTIAEKYPETEMGRYVKGHCDELADYIIRPLEKYYD